LTRSAGRAAASCPPGWSRPGSAAHDAAQPELAHQPPHPAAGLAQALAPHLLPHLVGAVRLVVLAPNALNDGLQHLVADRTRRALRRIGLCGFPPEVGGGGDRHDAANRLDPISRTMLVDKRDHHFGRRSSSACAKNADALRRISLARFSSTTSRSSILSARARRWSGRHAGRHSARPGAPTAAASRSYSRLSGRWRQSPPLRAVLSGVFLHQPHEALSYLRRILAGSCHGSILSTNGPSDNPGAVHFGASTHPR
jgi:hypothetical protein